MTPSSFFQQLGRRLLDIGSRPVTAWVLTALIAIFSVIRISLVMEQVIPGVDGRPNGPADFQAYYLDALSMRLGYGPYTAAFQPEVIEALSARLHVEDWAMVYYYPPLTAQLIMPLTLLPPKAAGYLWMGLLTAAALAAAWLLGKSSSQPYGVTLALLLVPLFMPTGISILAGQVNVLVLLALCGAYCAARRARWATVGAGVAVAAMLKIVPGVYVVWLGLTRRWRALAASVLTGLLLVAISLPWVGISGWLDFLRLFLEWGGRPIFSHPMGRVSISLAPGIGLLLGSGPVALAVWRIGVWTIMLVTGLALAFRPERGDWEMEFSALVFLANLFPVYTGYAQACLYTIPFFSLILRTAQGPHRRWLWLWLAAYAAMEITVPAGIGSETTLVVSLLLWGGLVVYLLRKKLR